MKYLLKILTGLNKIFCQIKSKFKMLIFTLLDAVEQQFGKWYFFELNIKTDDFKNEYTLPVLCCMREKIHAESLMNQIQKDLINNNLILLGSSITEMTVSQKNAKINELEAKFNSNESVKLRVLLYDLVKKRNRPIETELFNEEDLNPTNLNPFYEYKLDITHSVKLNVVKNQGVPFTQIKDLFVVKIDKSNLK
ncbi:hypothetical protein [Flavobacterium beibuense]|uniref:hypothetical protein n=1 Tax=Flavobacterium beibuense TaxID=657326 RepID=UPI003A92B592